MEVNCQVLQTQKNEDAIRKRLLNRRIKKLEKNLKEKDNILKLGFADDDMNILNNDNLNENENENKMNESQNEENNYISSQDSINDNYNDKYNNESKKDELYENLKANSFIKEDG